MSLTIPLASMWDVNMNSISQNNYDNKISSNSNINLSGIEIDLKDKLDFINVNAVEILSFLKNQSKIPIIKNILMSRLNSIHGMENSVKDVLIIVVDNKISNDFFSANLIITFNEDVKFKNYDSLLNYKLSGHNLVTTKPIKTSIPKLSSIDLSNKDLLNKFDKIISQEVKDLKNENEKILEEKVIKLELNDLFKIENAVEKVSLTYSGHENIYRTVQVIVEFSDNVKLLNVNKIEGYQYFGSSQMGGSLLKKEKLISSTPVKIDLNSELKTIEDVLKKNINSLSSVNYLKATQQNVLNELNKIENLKSLI